jgi:hypothetical protein
MRTPSQHDYPIEILFDLTPGKIDIPLDWTVEQADRFVSTLANLEEAVWSLYGDAIIERDRTERLIDEHFESDDDTHLSSDDITTNHNKTLAQSNQRKRL